MNIQAGVLEEEGVAVNPPEEVKESEGQSEEGGKTTALQRFLEKGTDKNSEEESKPLEKEGENKKNEGAESSDLEEEEGVESSESKGEPSEQGVESGEGEKTKGEIPLDDIMKSLDEGKREAIRKILEEKDLTRRSAQKESDESKAATEKLLQQIADLKGNLDSVNQELAKQSQKKLEEDADVWVQKFDRILEEEESKGVKEIGSTLYKTMLGINKDLTAKLTALTTKVDEGLKKQSDAALIAADDVLENVEHRLNPEYEEVVSKVTDDQLVAYLEGNKSVADKFRAVRAKKGYAHARFVLAKQLQKALDIQNNPDDWVHKNSKGENPEEEKPKKLKTSSLNSKNTPVEVKENAPATALQKFFARKT